MEYQYVVAAEWWVKRLQYIPNHPDVAHGALANLEKMKMLTDVLAESIKTEVNKWGDMIQPYSIDTTFDPGEEILVKALKAAKVSGVQFPSGVVMEFTKKCIVVSEQSVIFGEE